MTVFMKHGRRKLRRLIEALLRPLSVSPDFGPTALPI